MCKEINEKLEKSKPVEPVQMITVVRNNIASARNMFEKDNNETNELRNKHTEITSKRVDDVKLELENNDGVAGDSIDVMSKLIQNGSSDGTVVVTPPKPLPRRTSSISESEDVPTPPKPAARPRTNSVITSVSTQPTATTYKVRSCVL